MNIVLTIKGCQARNNGMMTKQPDLKVLEAPPQLIKVTLRFARGRGGGSDGIELSYEKP